VANAEEVAVIGADGVAVFDALRRRVGAERGMRSMKGSDLLVAALENEGVERITERADESRYPLTPQRIVHDVRHVMPDDGIVCLDNGMHKIWFARNYRTHVANTLLLDNALATMGAGLPAGIMAALLYPQRRVLRCAATAAS
jgi:acetolactate synthase I/II/III large subunit